METSNNGGTETVLLVSSSRLGGKFPQRSEHLIKAFRKIGLNVLVVESHSPLEGIIQVLKKRRVRAKIFSGFRAGFLGLILSVFGMEWVYDLVEVKAELCRDNWRGARRALIPFIGWVEGLMVKNAKVVYAVSEETVEFSKEKGKIPTVAENGVDDELFNPSRIDGREMKKALGAEFPLVIFVGKITPMYAKYLAAAIVAMRDVNERIPEAEFWIFGDGPCRAHLEDLASSSTGKVRFRGYIEHDMVPEVVAAADVGINAYRTGSIKMKEWAAMGLPIIGPQEMKEDFVRRCEWVPDKIAKEIVEILKNQKRDVVKVNTWSDTAKIMAETLANAGLLRVRSRSLIA